MMHDLDPTRIRDHIGLWAGELSAWMPEEIL